MLRSENGIALEYVNRQGQDMNENNQGKLYGVGVGPGDSELLTVKAVRVIEKADVIAFPGKTKDESISYAIPADTVPGYAEKETLPIELPMTRDREKLKALHEKAVGRIENCLRIGKDVAFLTLGDPSIYSTYAYIDEKIRADGFKTEIIPGVASFSAAAAKLYIPIALGSESVKIIAGLDQEPDIDAENLVILKAGRHAGEIRDRLKTAGYKASMICNAGMRDEKIYPSIEDIPEAESYFSLILAKRPGSVQIGSSM